MASHHTPEEFLTCEKCGGEGAIPYATWVYEHGCGFGHDDVAEERCDACNGAGGSICEARAESIREREAILERHEKLLWWMTDQARFAFIAELREDYIFEEQLRFAGVAMSADPALLPASELDFSALEF